ncbi:MAG: type II secretion system F family protein [Phycisphaerae bacterium]
MTTPVMLGIMGVAGIALVIYALRPAKKDEQAAVARRMRGKTSKDETKDIQERARESVAAKMMDKVAPIAMRPVMPKTGEEMTRLRMKLAAAGYRTDKAPMFFLGSKTIVGILAGIAVGVYSLSRGHEMQQVLGLAIFGAAMGFMAPNLWLSSGIKKRGGAIRQGLPDSLDLMVISVEAGLALDGAMKRVSEELITVHPALSEELQIATREAQMGIPRSEALANMAERTQVPEVKSLVAIVNQAEKFGTSIARALRNQADSLRVKRRQAAEERAQKVAVKLMLPLMLFIFPAIFVVLVGPAAVRMMKLADTNSSLF